MKTGMIGLGAMGVHMARNMAKAGYLSALWNRSQAKAEKLAAELGVVNSPNPSQLAKMVDVVLVCVSADNDVLEVVQALLEGLGANKIVIDMSTVSSETACKAGKMLAERNVAFLDAPVSGGVEGAKNGTLAMMVGGDIKVLEKVRPVLDSMAARVMLMGETGSGQGTKAVNQLMAAGINQAVTEALAFGAAQGLDMQKLIEVVSSGAAANWFLEHRGPSMVAGRFEPGFKLALHHKDLDICRAMAEPLGVPTTLIDLTLTDYAHLMKEGYGEEDISALYRLKAHA